MEENKREYKPENDGDFIIGEGFNIDDSFADDEQQEDKTGSTGALKSVIWIVSIIVVSLAIAFGVIYAGADFLGIGFGRGKNCVMDIPQGASATVISEKLEESGAVKIPMLFRLYSKLKHYDAQFKYGIYTFNNELGYEGIADMLITEGAKAETKTVTIPESNIDDIAEVLQKNGICEKSDFFDVVANGNYDYFFIEDIPTNSVYYRLEGYLFPDTYSFYVCENSKDGAYLAVDSMLKELEKKTLKYKSQIESGKYSFHEILTLASIIQLEGGNTETVSDTDRKKVSAIFYNRLNSDEYQTLGSSPTRKYPHGEGRYDTYQCKGLPPGPLCSPNIASIDAAVNPASDMAGYYYFVTDAQMKFYYRKTLSEHNAIISKLQKEKNWIYED